MTQVNTWTSAQWSEAYTGMQNSIQQVVNVDVHNEALAAVQSSEEDLNDKEKSLVYLDAVIACISTAAPVMFDAIFQSMGADVNTIEFAGDDNTEVIHREESTQSAQQLTAAAANLKIVREQMTEIQIVD